MILNGVPFHGGCRAPGPPADVSGAPDVNMITARNEGPDLPSDPSIDLDGDQNVAVGLVLTQSDEVVGSDGDVVAVDEGGPDVDLLVTLIRGRDGGAIGDLLVAIVDVGVETVVVDSDPFVGVAGQDGHLEIYGQEVGHAGIEGVHGDVLQDEGWLGRPQGRPDDENRQQNYEQEYKNPHKDSSVYFPATPLVVLTHFNRHRSCPAGPRSWRFFLSGEETKTEK